MSDFTSESEFSAGWGASSKLCFSHTITVRSTEGLALTENIGSLLIKLNRI
jgi:hypothetical protein